MTKKIIIGDIYIDDNIVKMDISGCYVIDGKQCMARAVVIGNNEYAEIQFYQYKFVPNMSWKNPGFNKEINVIKSIDCLMHNCRFELE